MCIVVKVKKDKKQKNKIIIIKIITMIYLKPDRRASMAINAHVLVIKGVNVFLN